MAKQNGKRASTAPKAAAKTTRQVGPKSKQQLMQVFKKRQWADPLWLGLVEAVYRGLEYGKKNFWPRLKRDARYDALITSFTKHKEHYNRLVEQMKHIGPLFHNKTFIPMLKSQRIAEIPLSDHPLTYSTSLHPPQFGPRYGCADSDVETEEFGARERPAPEVNQVIAQPPSAGGEDAEEDISPTLPIIYNTNHPGPFTFEERLQERVTQATKAALKLKITSLDYQTTLMRHRYDYNKAQALAGNTNPQSRANLIDIPPVNGIRYFTFPIPYPVTVENYLAENQEDDDFDSTRLRLIAPSTFFPSLEDEYRFIYSEMYFYYTSRSLPLTLHFNIEHYLSPEHYKQCVRNPEHSYAELLKTQHDNDDEEEMTAAQRRKSRSTVLTQPATIQYATPLSSFKTFLNNIVGMPLWYSVVFANFIYKLQAFSVDDRNTQPPLFIIQQLQAYQRKIITFVLNAHFNQYRTTVTQNISNPKDRYLNQFVGGGRISTNASPFFNPTLQHAPFPATAATPAKASKAKKYESLAMQD